MTGETRETMSAITAATSRPCECCGVAYEPSRADSRYCRHACSDRAYRARVRAMKRAARAAAQARPDAEVPICRQCFARMPGLPARRRYCDPCQRQRHADSNRAHQERALKRLSRRCPDCGVSLEGLAPQRRRCDRCRRARHLAQQSLAHYGAMTYDDVSPAEAAAIDARYAAALRAVKARRHGQAIGPEDLTWHSTLHGAGDQVA